MNRKVPQSEWPVIATRHKNGETQAAIARSLGVSASAINNILRRQAGTPVGDAPATPIALAEADAPDEESDLHQPMLPLVAERIVAGDHSSNSVNLAETAAPLRESSVTQAKALSADVRSVQTSASLTLEEELAIEIKPVAQVSAPPISAGTGHAGRNGTLQSPQGRKPNPVNVPQGQFSRGSQSPERRSDGQNAAGSVPRPRNPGQYKEAPDVLTRPAAIDSRLEEEVETAIAGFRQAFRAMMASNSHSTRAALIGASDQLMRAGARTRILLSRLETQVSRK